MRLKYNRTRENGDATTSYDIEGDFPIKFEELFNYICENDGSFRIEFGSSNEKFGDWLGNRLEVSKNTNTKEWHLVEKKPDDWYETIKDLPVTKCWANGGWGQMLYIVTFDEEVLKGDNMGKVIHEFETEYNVGDVVIFEKNGLQVGIVEGYYVEDGYFWFNIRISPTMVYTYSNDGDIAEFDIMGKLDGELRDRCREKICS